MDFLRELNKAQLEAVRHTEGPSMIIAGAGSGKTRVLTYRIAYLIQHRGVDPFSIMALTFTNKAADEMRHRIESITGPEARNIWMGTFHSVFARILRAEAHRLGYPNSFTIYDTDDSKSLLKSIVRELNLDEKTYNPGFLYSHISRKKNQLINWEQYLASPEFMEEDQQNGRPDIGRIFKAYALRCFAAGAMDFDDLLLNTHRLFTEHLDVLSKYQHRIRYILVDEFQDTNLCQYYIIRKLANVHQNICVVGDDAQSIYSFRGATIANMLHFERDYQDLQVFKLEQNYRSTRIIVEAANSVIRHNTAQLPKVIWTENEEGAPIEIIKALNDSDEGKLVCTSIFEEKMQHQLSYSDFAILYRTNAQSRTFEEHLRRLNIPYRIVGGLSFYQRKEIKDVLAYLRFTLNHNDEASFRRIINLPRRGIGETTINKIIVAANTHNISIWEVLLRAPTFLGNRMAGTIENFVTLIQRCELEVKRNDAYHAALEIINASGLLRELFEEGTAEGINRKENIDELLNAIRQFVDQPDREDKSLAAFLQEVSLLTGQDEMKEEDKDKVTLMTIHTAKGLEFNHVYVVGMEEDLFPSINRISSRAELEEERRLFYVAITRARKRLFLSYALTRYSYGGLRHCTPSRFLKDIHPDYVRTSTRVAGLQSSPPSSDFARKLINGVHNRKNSIPERRSSYTPPLDFTPSDTRNLAEGMRVEHPRFGFGTVLQVDADIPERKARILFDDFGEKTLLLSFAKLKIHQS